MDNRTTAHRNGAKYDNFIWVKRRQFFVLQDENIENLQEKYEETRKYGGDGFRIWRRGQQGRGRERKIVAAQAEETGQGQESRKSD